MARDRDRRKVVWPSYFDVKLSKAAGRRLRKAFCIDNPDTQKISDALRSLNLKHEVQSDKAFPSRWWKKEGRVLVDTDMTKVKLLQTIGKKLQKRAES